VHRRDAVGRHVAKYGEHEPELTRFIAQHLARASQGVVVDVGANFGWHALHMARSPRVETIIAFEPDLFNAWLLDRNIAANGSPNVIVSTAALGARSGTAPLYRYKPSNLGRHSLIADTGLGSRLVPLIELDRALDELGFGAQPVALIKIDVEGYEPAVVAGAERTLARTEAVVLEYSPERSLAGGLSTEEMIDRLEGCGFGPHLLGAAGEVRAVERAKLRAVDHVVDLIWLRH
jgi:FkbM family methyltransferase